MKITNAQNGNITVEIKSYNPRTPDAQYETTVNVQTGACVCSCPQHSGGVDNAGNRYEGRIALAARILNVKPNAKGDVSCKHAKDAYAKYCA